MASWTTMVPVPFCTINYRHFCCEKRNFYVRVVAVFGLRLSAAMTSDNLTRPNPIRPKSLPVEQSTGCDE